MTCILGMEHQNKVYIGGDSARMSGWERNILSSHKVFRLNDFLIGYSGAVRMQNIMHHCVTIDRRQADDECEEQFVVTGLVEAVRKAMKDNGYITGEQGRDTTGNNAFLAGYRGKLYWIGSDFDVSHFTGGIAAVGTGADYALGALRMQLKMREQLIARGRKVDPLNPETMIWQALEIATEYCASVAPPFYVECL